MTAKEALNLVKDDIEKVEQFLKDDIKTSVPLINEVILYLLSSGGKRLRPVFLALSARMCGYTGENIPTMSAVIEYIHTATLLHDDIIDGAKYRRKRPTANSLYGNDVAVLCGDFLYSRSYITLTEYGAKQVQMILSSAALTMSEGEVIQLLKTGDINLTFDDYIQIITRKTAVLFSAACEIGGRLAEVSEDKIKALKDFGYYLGLGFQMTDDILDYMGNPEITGKKNGTDLFEGKLTLPVIKTLEKADNNEKNIITEMFKKKERNDDDLKIIKDIMEKYDIEKVSEKTADEYINKSLQSLNVFEDNDYRKALIALALAMVGRAA
ncbi:MAG TPA: polyprenyl synthetase family protein [Candidatus Mucispirillum faecigallinarum]|uniref:Polyprenyl synthetase family protein n=1 Tax=Candidatus Mucispirillum faecigallinarum TaxID=2838699 RepID=A0A9D2KCG5_9BACT|nr:polyprenyl synthetase family protein [Candidatus Mucispirillum faecigallinarum]